MLINANFNKKSMCCNFINFYAKYLHGLKTPVSKPDGDTSNNLG